MIHYLCLGLDFNHDAFVTGPGRKALTRGLGKLQPLIVEDIRCSMDNAMGLDTESWKVVCITKAMEDFGLRSISSVLVRSRLCQNENCLYDSIAFATWLGAGAELVGAYTPWISKPVLGYLGT